MCDASDFTLVFSFTSVFLVILTFSDLIFSKAMVWSSDQVNIDFLLNSGLNGLPNDARFGRNFINWLVDPKNESNSFKFRGIVIDFIDFIAKGRF